MNVAELNKKEPKDLQKLLKDEQVALREFRFNQGGSKLKNVREGRARRKDIARIMTVLNQKKA
jgi:ribosomal protein L29